MKLHTYEFLNPFIMVFQIRSKDIETYIQNSIFIITVLFNFWVLSLQQFLGKKIQKGLKLVNTNKFCSAYRRI